MARRTSRTWRSLIWSVSLVVTVVAAAPGGGTPEEALVIIDPQRTDAMYVANHYLDARQIPGTNVLYLDPTASDYPTFVENNIDALDGTLANARIGEHIHYVVIAPASSFYVHAPDLVGAGGCPAPVTRFSLSSVYTLKFISTVILGGTTTVTRRNRYFGEDNAPLAFDSQILWKRGVPSDDGTGQRYYIAAYLGYTGARGNTVDELIEMIDRGVAVDGTFPASTFYYMETTDEARSGPRDGYYPTAVTDITALGGSAEHLLAVLPTGRHDCMGIMTGWASPDIDGTDMTILPGAICDHLTSFAATFDTSSQVKLSRWIANGAGGSWGTVQEPCNFAGKFPHPRVYVYYFQGLSLGESLLRSARFLPFQGLLYGDPLTRPFAHLPDVEVADAPTGTVSGSIVLTPTATTSHPTAQIARFDLLIDGVRHGSITPGEQFAVDTSELFDGWHDLRVIAYDDLDQRFTGRWIGGMTTDNRSRAATLDITPSSGNWTTAFSADVASAGTEVVEVRLLHNSRVVSASAGASAQLTVFGLTLGAGPVHVQAEAMFADGERVRSAPTSLQIDYLGDAPSGNPPVAFSYTKHVLSGEPFVVELPATFDDPDTALTYELLSEPLQSTVVTSSGPYRLMRADPLAEGIDPFTFRVNSAAGASNLATVTLDYLACIGDLTGDGRVDLADLAQLLAHYGTASGAELEDGDLDGDGDVDLSDLAALLAHYGEECG